VTVVPERRCFISDRCALNRSEEAAVPGACDSRAASTPPAGKQGIEMTKKTVASLGVVAAASAGALLLTGSPASAAPVRTVAHIQHAQQVQHQDGYRGHGRVHHGHRYGHHHHGWYRHGDDIRIVIRNNDTNVAIGG
jgi:hypothetical protein